MTRRGFFKKLGVACAMGGATYAYGAGVEVHHLVTEQVAVRVPGLSPARHRTRLVQLSDFHVGRTSMNFIEHAFATALALKPDYLVLTGDFIDSPHSDIGEICNVIARFAAMVPTLGCTGNHDYSNNHALADHVSNALSAAGVTMLRNDVYQPMAGAGELCFIGLDDLWYNLDPAAFRKVPADASVIVLSHNPDSYDDIAAARWHLMLSGHTHGGQVCIPGIGPLVLPVKHRERAAGLFHLDASKPDRTLYVSRGVGHLLGFRLFCPPEVTCITLLNPDMPA